MKFDEICKYLLTEAYKDKYLVIDEDRLDSFRKEILIPGSDAQAKLQSIVSNPQVGLKMMGPKQLLIILNELEDFFISPAMLDEILQTLMVNVRDLFPDVSGQKAKRAAKKLFTFLKSAGVFVFAAPEKERDIDKILSDPEAGEWMGGISSDETDDFEDYGI